MTEIVISTDPERDNLIAEAREGTYAWADVRYDDGKEAYELTLYPPSDDEWFVIDFTEARKALLAARDALVAKVYPNI